ncbi:MAG: prolipoprotein diacylglyceryl transferase [Clostridia bacterium]|jgi:phosphatidylglycerol:prolipoprotein diacylglycerol transferase
MKSTVSFPNLFGGIELSISRVAFSIFGFEVYWYGLIISCAVCLAVVLVLRAAKKYGIKEDDLLNICLVGIIFGVLCGRGLYILGTLENEWTFREMLNIRDGGMSIFGALIGGFISASVYCKISKINFLKLGDLIVPYIALAQAIGRWGNFFNKEAYGLPVNPSSILSSLGMTSMKIGGNIAGTIEEELYSMGIVDSTLVATVNDMTFDYIGVHPTFFYESVCNLVLFLILILIAKNGKYFNGRSLCIYAMSYGTYRFFIEGIRIDPLYLGNTDIKLSRLIALICTIFFGLMLIIISIMRAKDKKMFLKSLVDDQEIEVGTSEYKDILVDKETYIPDENNDIKNVKDELTEEKEVDTKTADMEQSVKDEREVDIDKK